MKLIARIKPLVENGISKKAVKIYFILQIKIAVYAFGNAQKLIYLKAGFM